MRKVYKVSDIRNLIRESSLEYKAKLGTGVENKNKEINDKAYKDMTKAAKDYDGGLTKEVGEEKPDYKKDDFNATTLDYQPEGVTPEYKKRVKAQAEGYTSEDEKNNGIEKASDFDDNEKIYKEFSRSGKEMRKKKKELAQSGLQAREWKDETFREDKNEMTESKIRTAYFKKTEFITENHMISKIPDEFKKEGNKFKMVDKTKNTYLLEWKEGKPSILGHTNKAGMDESLERMRELFGYQPVNYVKGLSKSGMVSEGKESFTNILNITRKIKADTK